MSSKVKYSVKNDIQHVLDCSDVYIGDTGAITRREYVFSKNKITSRIIDTPEALIRIFVEVLTNAVDNVERSKNSATPTTAIKINIDPDTGLTSVWNDGQYIPIIKQKEQSDETDDGEFGELYIHSLIFGHLRSSSNYGNEEIRELSGKNGVGVKCTNIFSSWFSVSGTDPSRKLKLTQEWTNNMTQTNGPIIKPYKHKMGHTEVKYIPDFARFKCSRYPSDILDLFKKLVVDISALLPNTEFWFCGDLIEIRDLLTYARLYYPDSQVVDMIDIKYQGSELVIVGAETGHNVVSFVNGQITGGGGQHTQSWTKTVFSGLLEALNSKADVKLTKSDISPFFQFFIHSRVNKPKFDGQNKNVLKNPKIVSHIEPRYLNKILKWSVIATIKNRVLRSKELLTLKKIEKCPKTKIVQIDGYDPANTFGVESILIVCEGLSAKSYAVAGIQTGIFGKKGRNNFGILPLRGKFLNVKNVSLSKIGENKVVSDLIKTLNLRFNVDYSVFQNYRALNYGTLLILTDADKDGIHIKGLIINFFEELFPSLFRRKDFIISMETPIVEVFAKKGKKSRLFYDENTFEKYRKEHENENIQFKYYKGLGTIRPSDVSSFFGQKIVKYRCDSKGSDTINKVFKDDFANARKEWLSFHDPKVSKYCLDEIPAIDNVSSVKVSDFMEHEMIKFSYEDCKRSLPSCLDGLKESQRKVIYAIRKKFKSTSKFLKVVQLSGYVAEQTDYKHGEQNLCETIIKLAQQYVGTNNLPLLEPDGQFGSRLSGGKDAANERYIFTKPSKVLKYIFREEDDNILTYTNENEPCFFVPIIPLILVNGSVGIGTGWSCFVPQFNHREIISYLKLKLAGETTEPLTLVPWYKGFKGKIKSTDKSTRFVTYGKMKQLDNTTLHVTELPIGMWTDKFKEQCHELIEKGSLSRLINESGTDKVSFYLKGLADLSEIKLTSKLHTSNMVLFNEHDIITKYQTVNDILTNYYSVRLHYYELRKKYLIQKLKMSIKINENKLRFIFKVVNNDSFLKQDEDVIITELEMESFLKVDETFNYLLNIPIRNCTVNAIKKLELSIKQLEQDLEQLILQTISKMWLNDLLELEQNLEPQ